MTSSAGSDATIIPITLTVNGRTGLTLYAPPWEDSDGDLWQGFLGDGAKILLYPSAAELAAFVASGAENDLSDHPAWGTVLSLRPDQLRPGGEDGYDLDAVYEWAGDEPDPVHVSALANVVDMVGRIADCCDDGGLRALVEGTPAYAELVDENVSYQGKDGRRAWNELGDTIASTWERAVTRVESWLSWQGDFDSVELESETVWTHVDAEPIAMRLDDVTTYLTVRAFIPEDTEDAPSAAFLGDDDTVAVFADVTDLATYCRAAREHRLVKLEWWSGLAEVEDDAVFAPAEQATIDLRTPSEDGAQLLRQIAAFCELPADLSVLDGARVDREDWRALVEEIRRCLSLQG